MIPKRPFSHIPVKITLLLAVAAIALASLAGAPASGAARRPGHPAQARPAPGAAQAGLPRAIALAAYGAPDKPGGQARPQPHGHRHAGHRHHRYRRYRRLGHWHHRHHRYRRLGHRHHRHHRYRRLGHRHHRYRHHRYRHHRYRQHRHRPHHRRRHRSPRWHRTPRQIAWSLLAAFHWTRWQFRYLDLLWIRESGWNPFAANPHSGAYGIPQALPGSKMASAGPNWRTSARTQIRWGMGYIKGRYITPWRAWQHELEDGWY